MTNNVPAHIAFAARLGRVVKWATDEYRPRVEIAVCKPDGSFYCGKWGDTGGYALPGGGIDPGETPEDAALRELREEAGIEATNARLLPVTTKKDWTPEERKQNAARGRNFKGSRTVYVLADYVKDGDKSNLDKWGAKEKAWRSLTDAEALMQNVPDTDVYKQPRITLLQHLQGMQAKQQKAAHCLRAVLLKAAAGGTLVPQEGVPDTKPPLKTTQTKRFNGKPTGVKMPVPYRVQQRTRSFAKTPTSP
jgi:putative (di)nucleoside polyphosphate hydrolase